MDLYKVEKQNTYPLLKVGVKLGVLQDSYSSYRAISE